MADITNIIAGPLTIYVAPTTEALTEINNLTPPAITITPAGNWTAVGKTMEDGHRLTVTEEFYKAYCMEHRGPVHLFPTREEARFEYAIAENDMTAFAGAMGNATLATVSAAADQTAQDTLGFGDGTVAYKSLLLLGSSPEGGSRVIHIYRAKRTGEVTAEWMKEHRGMAVGWDICVDDTKTAGNRMFKIYDITAAASS